MKKIAVFVSGSGSNAENIANYFQQKEVELALIVSNNPKAYALERAKKLSIKSITIDRAEFYETNKIVEILQKHEIDLLILAGFLWLVPPRLISAFPNKIINIHPALLPQYGGKGMYGMHVHRAVVKNKETETGITIHWVNEKYDDGAILFQAKCSLTGTDTPEDIAHKIHKLEFEHYPKIIETILFSN